MATIDADAHVVESEHTWDYMDPAERKYRPLLVAPDGAREEQPVRSILDTGSARSYWLIDGKIRGLARTVYGPHTTVSSGVRAILQQPRTAVGSVWETWG